MTLPKIFSLASKCFTNFDTMSFEANTITTANSLTHQEQEHQQPAPNSEQLRLSTLNNQHLTMSSSPMPNLNTNTMVGANSINSAQTSSQESKLLVECVMPRIYLTKEFISWNEEQLRAHKFTHIIIIDKHIQELYYPNQQHDIFKLTHSTSTDNSSSLNSFDLYCPPTEVNHLSFGKEFDVLDLNFREKSYLTTVLPNCYKAVQFINKGLQGGGKILVIDCNGGEQKCLTIVVAYLMYNQNISFRIAFARLKGFYRKADLDRFYMSQLYEYEPILQVQRAQSCGHSCSRTLHAAVLKRKKSDDNDDVDNGILYNNSTECSSSHSSLSSSSSSYNASTTTTSTTELLNNCNPLNRFDTTQMERQDIIHPPMMSTNHYNPNAIFTPSMSNDMTLSTTTTGGWYNWDDCAME